MNQERKLEIEKEARRRLSLWLENSSFDEMTVGFSRLRFEMSLGLIDGYPFEKLDWMKSKDFKRFVSYKEFDSNHYDEIIENLFNETYNNQYHETT